MRPAGLHPNALDVFTGHFIFFNLVILQIPHLNQPIPYPRKNDQNTLVIRGRVLGVVASSDMPRKDDLGILEELFVDEIQEFNEAHGVDR